MSSKKQRLINFIFVVIALFIFSFSVIASEPAELTIIDTNFDNVTIGGYSYMVSGNTANLSSINAVGNSENTVEVNVRNSGELNVTNVTLKDNVELSATNKGKFTIGKLVADGKEGTVKISSMYSGGTLLTVIGMMELKNNVEMYTQRAGITAGSLSADSGESGFIKIGILHSDSSLKIAGAMELKNNVELLAQGAPITAGSLSADSKESGFIKISVLNSYSSLKIAGAMELKNNVELLVKYSKITAGSLSADSGESGFIKISSKDTTSSLEIAGAMELKNNVEMLAENSKITAGSLSADSKESGSIKISLLNSGSSLRISGAMELKSNIEIFSKGAPITAGSLNADSGESGFIKISSQDSSSSLEIAGAMELKNNVEISMPAGKLTVGSLIADGKKSENGIIITAQGGNGSFTVNEDAFLGDNIVLTTSNGATVNIKGDLIVTGDTIGTSITSVGTGKFEVGNNIELYNNASIDSRSGGIITASNLIADSGDSGHINISVVSSSATPLTVSNKMELYGDVLLMADKGAEIKAKYLVSKGKDSNTEIVSSGGGKITVANDMTLTNTDIKINGGYISAQSTNLINSNFVYLSAGNYTGNLIVDKDSSIEVKAGTGKVIGKLENEGMINIASEAILAIDGEYVQGDIGELNIAVIDNKNGVLNVQGDVTFLDGATITVTVLNSINNLMESELILLNVSNGDLFDGEINFVAEARGVRYGEFVLNSDNNIMSLKLEERTIGDIDPKLFSLNQGNLIKNLTFLAQENKIISATDLDKATGSVIGLHFNGYQDMAKDLVQQLSGEVHTATLTMGLKNPWDYVFSSLNKDFQTGLMPIITFENVKSDQNASGYDTFYAGASLSANKNFGKFDIGMSLGAGYNTLKSSFYEAKNIEIHGGLYGNANIERVNLDLYIGYALNNINTNRSVAIDLDPVIDISAKYKVHKFDIAFEASYDRWALRPVAGLNYGLVTRGSFEEISESEIALSVDKSQYMYLASKIGLKYDVKLNAWRISIGAYYKRNLLNSIPEFNASFTEQTESFNIRGVEVGKDILALSFQMDYALANSNIQLLYSGELRKFSMTNSIGLKFNFSF